MGPACTSFLGPVLLEVPHFASLRHGERETAILRCDSAVKGRWVEHRQEEHMEKMLKVRYLQALKYLLFFSLPQQFCAPQSLMIWFPNETTNHQGRVGNPYSS